MQSHSRRRSGNCWQQPGPPIFNPSSLITFKIALPRMCLPVNLAGKSRRIFKAALFVPRCKRYHARIETILGV
jgi:hypothetical protein